MADTSTFTTPEFLENYDVDSIYEAMQTILPADIDSSEGGNVWNLTRPTALVLAELCEYVLPQVVQLIFPEWSYGEYLDAHAKTRGMTRKAATAATGQVTITGEIGTTVPAGSVFSTASMNNEDSSVSFETTEATTIQALNNLMFVNATTRTISGVTFTVNEDESITANGTATADSGYAICSDLNITPSEATILSGCQGGSETTYYLQAYGTTPTTSGLVDWNAIPDQVTIEANSMIQGVAIQFKSGASFDNFTFSPNIRYASETTGEATVDVECTETGTVGNTGADTIILVSSTLEGISAVTNAEETTGGTDEETDEELIERIDEYDQTQGASFIGNAADYRRWAMSVDGVGNATVVPATDDSGLVTIVVTDTNGDPGSEDLCTDVYDYIMSPDAPYSRLAPINATLSVVSPTEIAIGVKATVELTDTGVIENVQAAFLTSLTEYLPDATTDGEIKITKVAALLSATSGVNDFEDLQIGVETSGTITYGTSNITLDATQLPTLADANVILTEGTVS